MNKHTPGPLDVEPDNSTVQQCCICYGGSSFPGPMKEALEGHLSVLKYKYPALNAAPELLEACKDLICAVNLARQEQHARSFGDDLRTDAYEETADEMAERVAEIIDRARTIIAKAERGIP